MTSMTNTSSMAVMDMMPFHTAVGLDMLWFAPWMPSSAASTFGACVGLFFLGGFYRFLFAYRAIVDLEWLKKNGGIDLECAPDSNIKALPSFSPKFDGFRGLFEGFHSFIGYFLMLAVMLMNAWFFIAIILGVTVGEIAFGRFSRRSLVYHHI